MWAIAHRQNCLWYSKAGYDCSHRWYLERINAAESTLLMSAFKASAEMT